MPTTTLTADYLVIGSGAMGMAFTDVLLAESKASVIMVDRHHQPGGHWNDAYPFVRLHQPSSFYGVESKHLGSDQIDQVGWNKGLYELATNSEVIAYFDQVMNQSFLPSGRVQYFPSCDYTGDKTFVSRLSGATFDVDAKTVVDATYMNVTVPSVSGPKYEVAEGVALVPPNGLPQVMGQYDRYVIVGAGKTAMDSCLFLLKNGVDPDTIRWIMPRDSWVLDRAIIQPGEEFRERVTEVFGQQFAAIAESTSMDDMFDRVVQAGVLMPFDPKVRPTMYRCATVTHAELEQLRRIGNIVRKGRVQRIDTNSIVLDGGAIDTDAKTLHVNCTADGLERRPVVPIWQPGKITLQSVRTCQQVFSAAFLGHIEAAYDSDETKNSLCTVVPHPDTDVDFMRSALGNMANQMVWSQDPGLKAWLAKSRLDGLSTTPDADGPEAAAMIEVGMKAAEKLQAYIAEAEQAQA